MNLWLDDVRPAPIGYAWATTAAEAIELLKTGKVQFASLDHDLSVKANRGHYDNEETGYDVVCWMEENNVWPELGVLVHSTNPYGKYRMEQVILQHYAPVV